MKRLLRLYPTAWRARYGSELADLLDQQPADRRVALDLVRGAIVERARATWRLIPEAPLPAGGPSMFATPIHRHPTALALVAFVVVVPTTIVVGLSVLVYELGVIGLLPVIEPIVMALPAAELVNLFVQYAPFLALAVAVAPLVGIGLSRAGGQLLVTLAVRGRGLNLAVIGLCLLVLAVVTAHHFVEVMLETGL